MIIARIGNQEMTAEDFVKWLKLNGTFDELIEDVMTDKLTAHAAKTAGITVTLTEVQEKVDRIRRGKGLHRAKDTLAYLEGIGIDLEEFENHVTEMLYKEKMLAEIGNEAAVEDYFTLHSPQFDSIEVSHIVVDSEGKARELMAVLEEDPDSFAEMAQAHSLDEESRENGGAIGKVLRGSLQNEVEVKIFNAAPGALLGPFPSPEGLFYEIFRVNTKHRASLDPATAKEVRKLIYHEWLEARAREHRVEVL